MSFILNMFGWGRAAKPVKQKVYVGMDIENDDDYEEEKEENAADEEPQRKLYHSFMTKELIFYCLINVV